MSSLNVSGAFVYFVIPILGGIPITQTTVSSLIVTIVLIVLSIRLGKNLQKRPTGVQVLVEKGVSMLYGMVAETMGEHNLYWTPFIGTIFLSSILGSLIGMTLPFILRKLKIDPAVASSPLVTSLADILGVFIYLGIASALL